MVVFTITPPEGKKIATMEHLVFDGSIDNVIKRAADGGLIFEVEHEDEFGHEFKVKIILEGEDMRRMVELQMFGAI